MIKMEVGNIISYLNIETNKEIKRGIICCEGIMFGNSFLIDYASSITSYENNNIWIELNSIDLREKYYKDTIKKIYQVPNIKYFDICWLENKSKIFSCDRVFVNDDNDVLLPGTGSMIPSNFYLKRK